MKSPRGNQAAALPPGRAEPAADRSGRGHGLGGAKPGRGPGPLPGHPSQRACPSWHPLRLSQRAPRRTSKPNAPGKGGAQADIVLTAPQDGVPLLFIEVDNCHETAEEIAVKLEKYAGFFKRKTKDTDGRERPMWRTRWPAPAGRPGDEPHPPVLLVFNHIGARDPTRTVPRLIELTRHLWAGERQGGGYHLYDGKIPVIATGLRNLRRHGPAGPVFLRIGRDHMQPLLEAIGNPRREAADVREREAARARQEEYQAQLRRAAEQKAAEGEARRPVCASCGAKFTDDRWEATVAYPKPGPRWHPPLCDGCEDEAIEAASRNEDERQEQDQAVPEQRTEGGWFARPFRGVMSVLCFGVGQVGWSVTSASVRGPARANCPGSGSSTRPRATRRLALARTPSIVRGR
ncbi:hypothetical protein ABT288_37310 [Streptomyces sp. NPDC001093]|uniref:hypothetical protein n=1 Tax=Streptomyces sp. NPDC001093 TaxID=3154376 RepID=UPI0033268506